jgi:sugar phosphate isomerase/epimerase
MTVRQWIELASTLDIDGLEFYYRFIEFADSKMWSEARRIARDHDLEIPMLCASPDFTHPDGAFRQQQVEEEKRAIDMAAALGARFCRVLSGQRRPEVSRAEGVRLAAECIEACIPHAAANRVTLVIENHYKDSYWQFPEFAQKMDVFCELVERVRSSHLGVNYDPSNTILAGEDPLELLRRVKHRVVTMHASDRYLAEGTIEDLRKEEDSVGYAKRLRHGVIGRGLNDYDAIFSELKGVGFDGWISIEDGMNGMDDLRESVAFLRKKMGQHFGAGRVGLPA